MGKNLIFCFDGTCNDPEDSVQKLHFGEVEDHNVSNVLKLHLLLGGTLKKKQAVSDQMSFYFSGVGTYGNWLDQLRNKIRAPEHEDVGTIIKRATKLLYTYHQPDDLVYVFGFSRGAAIARRFASTLKDTFPALGKKAPEIRFLGVFDTVAAMNKPNLMKEEIKPASDVLFEDQTISSLIKEALHLLSLDERRIAFMPTLMNRDPGRVTEVWFSGAHSDVGGGFYYDGLSDLTLQFLLDEIVRRNLPLKLIPAAAVRYSDLFDDDQEEAIELQDVLIQPNHLGKNHQQHAITAIKEAFLGFRTPRINVHDKQSIYPPLIHRSVFDRMVDDPQYDPVALRSHMVNPYTDETVPFRVWYGAEQSPEVAHLHDAELAATHHPTVLKQGQSRSFTVYANQKFSDSRVLVKPGEKYRFDIDLEQRWFDGPVKASPRGWLKESEEQLRWYGKLFSHAVEGQRRHPDAAWFEVIGTVNRDDHQPIKLIDYLDTPWEVRESGEFFAFPNDLDSKYGNNLGTIQVSIKRVG